jgi:hypothetical protein
VGLVKSARAVRNAEVAAIDAAAHATNASINVHKITETIDKLEINTNSIKDALVAVTEKEAFARGKLEGPT